MLPAPSFVPHYAGPLLLRASADALLAARACGKTVLSASFDLDRSITEVSLDLDAWTWNGSCYPYPAELRERTIYHWDGEDFSAISRYGNALIKLVPTDWGAPTFEIDGIKMLPTSRASPFDDARNKVDLIEPHGKVVPTCGGRGYFAAPASKPSRTHPFLRKERRRAVAAFAEPVVARPLDARGRGAPAADPR